MTVSFKAFWISLLVFCCSLPATAQDRIEIPLKATRISDRVMVVCTEDGWGNTMAICSQRGIVITGTQWSESITRQYRATIEEAFGRGDFAYVINSGTRVINSGGNMVYPEALTVARESTRDRMIRNRENLESLVQDEIETFTRKAQRSRTWLENNDPDSAAGRSHRAWMNYCQRIADDLSQGVTHELPRLTFSENITLHLGDMTLRIIDFPNNGYIMLIPEEGLVRFSGGFDPQHLITASLIPNEEPMQVPRWLQVLDSVLSSDFEIKQVVLGFKGIWTVEKLRGRRDYIERLWRGVIAATEEGLDYAAARQRLSLDNEFSYIKQWDLYKNSPPGWVEEDHDKALRLFWLQHHESAVALIRDALAESGVDAAEAVFNEIRADTTNRYFINESEMNYLGYQLMGEGRLERAIAVFRMNVELFPGSANAYDSLGEAYMTAAQNDLAAQSYRRSLELNPENDNARQMLERLGTEQ